MRTIFLQALWSLVLSFEQVYSTSFTRAKREYSGMYETFGDSRKAALSELNGNQNVAMWSAQSAVTSSLGQVYGHEQASLTNVVHEYLIPMKKAEEQRRLLSLPNKFSEHLPNQEESQERRHEDEDENEGERRGERFVPEESRQPSETRKTAEKGNPHRRDTINPKQHSDSDTPKKSPRSTKPTSTYVPKKKGDHKTPQSQ